MARSVGLNASDLRRRAGDLIDAMVANRVEATERTSSLPGATLEMVEHVAELVETNAVRVGGCLRAAATPAAPRAASDGFRTGQHGLRLDVAAELLVEPFDP